MVPDGANRVAEVQVTPECPWQQGIGLDPGTGVEWNTWPMHATGSHLDRITVDPAVCHGKPIIRGMRWPVQTVLELLASDMTFEEILADHPELERDDLLASLEFAAAQAAGQYVVPFTR